jgi:hypothetical protein
VSTWALEGKGWTDTDTHYARIPARAKETVRDWIWMLGHHTAGLIVRFESDTRELWVRYTLLRKRFPPSREPETLAKPGMAATGKSGLDFYAQEDSGRWRWLAGVGPTEQIVETRVVEGVDPGRRAYMVYLPLRNGIESLEIGFPAGAAVEPLAPRAAKPLVFYGTSITQGTGASRPGMAYPAILGRRFERPVINLGFCGTGQMDPEVGALLGELEAAVYIIDCLPNMTGDMVAERAQPLVRQLRRVHPSVPIVLVEERHYDNAVFIAAHRARHAANNNALRAAYDQLIGSGVRGLYYVEGDRLWGDDGEATAYSGHPSDLGMKRTADVLEPVLRPLLPGA